MVNNINREFAWHVVKAKIEHTEPLTLHTLRKSACKNWLDRIPNPWVAQELMGHANLFTTMKYYSKVVPCDMTKAASAVDDLLSRSDANVTPDDASA